MNFLFKYAKQLLSISFVIVPQYWAISHVTVKWQVQQYVQLQCWTLMHQVGAFPNLHSQIERGHESCILNLMRINRTAKKQFFVFCPKRREILSALLSRQPKSGNKRLTFFFYFCKSKGCLEKCIDEQGRRHPEPEKMGQFLMWHQRDGVWNKFACAKVSECCLTSDNLSSLCLWQSGEDGWVSLTWHWWRVICAAVWTWRSYYCVPVRCCHPHHLPSTFSYLRFVRRACGSGTKLKTSLFFFLKIAPGSIEQNKRLVHRESDKVGRDLGCTVSIPRVASTMTR